MLQILHNPRCGKSRDCIALITESKLEFETILYLEKPLDIQELKTLIKKLNIKPIELVRQKEIIWVENYKEKSLSDIAIVRALAKHPILIERPILIDGDKAIIGRDLDKLKGFI
jgi:arsenate reductase